MEVCQNSWSRRTYRKSLPLTIIETAPQALQQYNSMECYCDPRLSGKWENTVMSFWSTGTEMDEINSFFKDKKIGIV